MPSQVTKREVTPEEQALAQAEIAAEWEKWQRRCLLENFAQLAANLRDMAEDIERLAASFERDVADGVRVEPERLSSRVLQVVTWGLANAKVERIVEAAAAWRQAEDKRLAETTCALHAWASSASAK